MKKLKNLKNLTKVAGAKAPGQAGHFDGDCSVHCSGDGPCPWVCTGDPGCGNVCVGNPTCNGTDCSSLGAAHNKVGQIINVAKYKNKAKLR